MSLETKSFLNIQIYQKTKKIKMAFPIKRMDNFTEVFSVKIRRMSLLVKTSKNILRLAIEAVYPGKHIITMVLNPH
jgi:hypothetical protein